MQEFSENALSQIADLFRRVQSLERGKLIEDGRLEDSGTPQSQQFFFGKPVVDLDDGVAGDFYVYSRGDSLKGNEEATGEIVENVYVRGFDVLAPDEDAGEEGDLCYIMYIDGGLEASKAVC